MPGKEAPLPVFGPHLSLRFLRSTSLTSGRLFGARARAPKRLLVCRCIILSVVAYSTFHSFLAEGMKGLLRLLGKSKSTQPARHRTGCLHARYAARLVPAGPRPSGHQFCRRWRQNWLSGLTRPDPSSGPASTRGYQSNGSSPFSTRVLSAAIDGSPCPSPVHGAPGWHPPAFHTFREHAWPHAAMLPVHGADTFGAFGRYGGPTWPPTLVIEVGTHTHFSRSRPAGLDQCGVPWAPGAQGTDGAVFAFGRWCPTQC